METKSIQVFNNTEFGEIRSMTIDGEPYFVGKDVAAALGYTNTRKALIDHVDDEDRTGGVTIRDSIGREQKPTIINESGMYSLILSSKLEGAKRFKRWVTSEVLPSIRKTGAFATDSAAAELKARELRVKEMNAQARLINAETRRLLILQKEKGLSKVAVDALAVRAMEDVTGKDLGEYLPRTEKTYSASEIGNALGISAAKVGKIANAYGLKTDEYGITVMDKSRYSSKEVAAFRYNEHGKQKIKEILEGSK
ncbi:BRO-N domain-containing protein [Ruminococcus sp.]|uniref:BRO-N domain-containing protein n=1 Tax=Ruminococcus sp. TaxID=41978 RepID=UPI002E77A87C|nr:Bro-N domain-containing protein [Ruminococcus sp.]MEE1264025.1 Bro-N domain-containing protein [Ruminococcus sp.]